MLHADAGEVEEVYVTKRCKRDILAVSCAKVGSDHRSSHWKQCMIWLLCNGLEAHSSVPVHSC